MKVLLLICVFELVVAQIAAADSPTEKIERNQISTEMDKQYLNRNNCRRTQERKNTHTPPPSALSNVLLTTSITNAAVTPTASSPATRYGFGILILLTTMITQQKF
ncbi:hypothetical protein FGIG_11411 [Fasciola gigantica]|uniref:Uncharacterized protein n=1 Tax=Fasciola gigantica TaxID=46835 RepID=A0A504Z115_FASGI|nr:hypothetical protein FGIG_11411 [Fasciola gigantica]